MAIAPPSWCKNAEPTPRGWVVKGELVKAMRISQEDIDIWHGNVPAQAPKPDPMMHTHDDSVTHSHDGGDMDHSHDDWEEHDEEDWEHLESMSKKELEALGREHGVELDRRLSKSKLIEEMKELLSD